MLAQHFSFSLLFVAQGCKILRRTHFGFVWYNLRRKHSYIIQCCSSLEENISSYSYILQQYVRV